MNFIKYWGKIIELIQPKLKTQEELEEENKRLGVLKKNIVLKQEIKNIKTKNSILGNLGGMLNDNANNKRKR